MLVTIFGGTGFIGKRLQEALKAKGHEVQLADLRRDLDWEKRIERSDAVINLAGSPIVGKRWNVYVKSEIHESRVDGTRKIVAALGKFKQKDSKERVLVNASAIGFYGPDGDDVFDENSPAGSDFLAFVCREWEAEAHRAEVQYGIRTAIVRIGVVLGKGGGTLAKLLPPFKLGLGGPIGIFPGASGKAVDFGIQWFSWVHLDDVVGIIIYALENKSVKGTLNASSPNPVRNQDFTKTLGAVLGRPAFFPLPGFMLHLIMGEAAEVVVNGQRVAPKATLESGYVFKYPALDDALKASI